MLCSFSVGKEVGIIHHFPLGVEDKSRRLWYESLWDYWSKDADVKRCILFKGLYVWRYWLRAIVRAQPRFQWVVYCSWQCSVRASWSLILNWINYRSHSWIKGCFLRRWLICLTHFVSVILAFSVNENVDLCRLVAQATCSFWGFCIDRSWGVPSV